MLSVDFIGTLNTKVEGRGSITSESYCYTVVETNFGSFGIPCIWAHVSLAHERARISLKKTKIPKVSDKTIFRNFNSLTFWLSGIWNDSHCVSIIMALQSFHIYLRGVWETVLQRFTCNFSYKVFPVEKVCVEGWPVVKEKFCRWWSSSRSAVGNNAQNIL